MSQESPTPSGDRIHTSIGGAQDVRRDAGQHNAHDRHAANMAAHDRAMSQCASDNDEGMEGASGTYGTSGADYCPPTPRDVSGGQESRHSGLPGKR